MTTTAEIAKRLAGAGLADDSARLEFSPLSGGVSSDIWRVTGGHQTMCVKRARNRLAVEANWEVPVERNHYEAEFLRVVATEVPGFAPELMWEDEAQGLIVLPYLEPSIWNLWKSSLLAGQVDLDVAANVGTHLGHLAKATRGRDDLAERFDTSPLFFDLRLDPYLLESARRHPDLAQTLTALAEATASRREALVHGDVSPKNILVNVGSHAMILDAECAWYGDPAFDLAFMLNHLLLKSVHRPESAKALKAAMETLLSARQAADTPAEAKEVQERATALLPGLFLARIDGKSPVEYLTDPKKQNAVRSVARRFLLAPANHPVEIATALNGDQSP